MSDELKEALDDLLEDIDGLANSFSGPNSHPVDRFFIGCISDFAKRGLTAAYEDVVKKEKELGMTKDPDFELEINVQCWICPKCGDDHDQENHERCADNLRKDKERLELVLKSDLLTYQSLLLDERRPLIRKALEIRIDALKLYTRG